MIPPRTRTDTRCSTSDRAFSSASLTRSGMNRLVQALFHPWKRRSKVWLRPFLAMTLIFNCQIAMATANEIKYAGSDSGTVNFKQVHCTFKSGHMYEFHYFVHSRNTGPVITFMALNRDNTNQHLGFVPGAENIHTHFFSASSAQGKIKGITLPKDGSDEVIRFTDVRLANPRRPGEKLTLNGTISCSKPQKQW